ncbi:MAG: signal peptidase II [Clostridia bacterium]|nr:signal peptidase II [Clostridia bacterium]
MMQLLLYLGGLLVMVGLDQWTKYLAILHLKGQENVILWPGVFELEYRENTGAAFSIMEGQSWFLIGFTSLALILVAVFLFRAKLAQSNWVRIAGVLILAGGIGNLIDRIFRGFVVDFLYFSLIDFPVFNVADCCVVIGAIALMVYTLFIYRDTPTTEQEAPTIDNDDTHRTGGSGGAEAG